MNTSSFLLLLLIPLLAILLSTSSSSARPIPIGGNETNSSASLLEKTIEKSATHNSSSLPILLPPENNETSNSSSWNVNTPSSPPPPATLYNFQNYILVLQWSRSLCDNPSVSRCESQWSKYLLSKFTIHGLWPDYGINAKPASSGTQLQIHKWKPRLLQDLYVDWPNAYYTSPALRNDAAISFWRHEWTNHGDFSGLLQENYMQTTDSLYKRFGDIYQGFKSLINPQKQMNVTEAAEWIEEKFIVKPYFKCIKNKLGEELLVEMHVIIRRSDLQMLPSNKQKASNCTTEIVFLRG